MSEAGGNRPPLSTEARVQISYERAQAIAGAVCELWAIFKDPICAVDGAAFTHLTIQYSLCSGIIAAMGQGPYIQPILRQILDFEVGQFCLTEVDHGLDAAHLGQPRHPLCRVVFARTIVREQDHGVKPFLFTFMTGSLWLLPHRSGVNPVNHAFTSFNNVRLPRGALLGTIEKPADSHAAYIATISRLTIGMVALTSAIISQFALSCHIVARYSQRRMVHGSSRSLIPIISFQTQRIPILTALAQVFVLRAMRDATMINFSKPDLDPRVRHAIATLFKVTSRCGAQGDLLVISIRTSSSTFPEENYSFCEIGLASELLLGRYALLPTVYPDNLLARHEAGLISQLRAQLAGLGNHRSAEYNAVLLPEALPLVQAIGQRIAYDAARTAGIDTCLLDMYVATCVRQDESWYVESLGMTRRELRAMETRAVDALFPQLDKFLTLMDVEAYVTAPIVSAIDLDLRAGAPGLPQCGQRPTSPALPSLWVTSSKL
ncbi:hypothetical protein BC834DRAFT_1017762 [Gloeopeniophorella convolvens]|nr:hypothetical protein BC834DRAFT_1017762 [Gloeopeniophorella convolvens]